MNARLRAVQGGDHGWLVELHNDPAVLRNITNPKPITLAEHAAWWTRVSLDAHQLRQVFEVDGERAGFAKFYAIDHDNKNCVLGADLHTSHRNRGLAKVMWRLMLDRCFNEFKLHRVSLTTADYNAVARHVYTKLGFLEEGRGVQSLYRHGTYYDVVCMYMLARMWKTS